MENNIKDKYNVDESYKTLSLQPYNYYKKGLKWYVLALVVIGLVCLYYRNGMPEYVLIIASTLTILIVLWMLKELLFRIPIYYTFDAGQNKVFKSNFFVKNKALFDLDKMVLFTSSDNEGWAYAIGEKRKHLIKSYKISEYFGDSKKSIAKADLYENEILSKINELVGQVNP
ncbi:hypothetical protein [Soonwooa sp.]|uniref:hypothetical protein n=1 Tax=Soonwooa sp. TaxID=1938592 RepID=UPI00260CB0CC|nr:hypothetical protein [Soonwooa sp.]